MKMLRRSIVLAAMAVGVAAAAELPQVSVTDYAGGRKAAISLTFDDAFAEHYDVVAPQLDRCGLKGTFAIIGSEMDDVDDDYAPRMTWEQCRRMVANGHEIANHTWSHRRLSPLSPDTIALEIAMTDSAMIAELGVASRTIIYPYNDFNDTVRAISERDKVGARTEQFGLGQHNNHCTGEAIDAFLNEVIANGLWGVTMSHGIHTGWDQWDEPDLLWRFFDTLAERSDEVWVDTFANVAAYIAERDATTIDVTTTSDTTIITPHCPLPQHLYNIPLTFQIICPDPSSVTAEQAGHPLTITPTSTTLLISARPHSPITLHHSKFTVSADKK